MDLYSFLDPSGRFTIPKLGIFEFPDDERRIEPEDIHIPFQHPMFSIFSYEIDEFIEYPDECSVIPILRKITEKEVIVREHTNISRI
jgi:hypothetical protein